MNTLTRNTLDAGASGTAFPCWSIGTRGNTTLLLSLLMIYALLSPLISAEPLATSPYHQVEKNISKLHADLQLKQQNFKRQLRVLRNILILLLNLMLMILITIQKSISISAYMCQKVQDFV